MKTLFQTIGWSLLAGVVIFGIAKLGHAVFDKENMEKDLQTSTQTVVIADDSPVGTYNWAAVVASIIALSVSALTLVSQNKVAENTRMLSNKAQEQVLYDLVRHLYRNMVVQCAITSKMEEITRQASAEGEIKGYAAYPSELHLIKAQAPIDNIHPELFVSDDAKYSEVNNLLLQLRNYNTELEVAARQLKDPQLSKEEKDYYINTLLFKPGNLTNIICKCLVKLKPLGFWARQEINLLKTLAKHHPNLCEKYLSHCIKREKLGEEYFDKEPSDLKNEAEDAAAKKERLAAKVNRYSEVREQSEMKATFEEIITKSHNSNVENNKKENWGVLVKRYDTRRPYTDIIFFDNREKFFAMLNEDAQIECGKNSSGTDKLLMIKF